MDFDPDTDLGNPPVNIDCFELTLRVVGSRTGEWCEMLLVDVASISTRQQVVQRNQIFIRDPAKGVVGWIQTLIDPCIVFLDELVIRFCEGPTLLYPVAFENAQKLRSIFIAYGFASELPRLTRRFALPFVPQFLLAQRSWFVRQIWSRSGLPLFAVLGEHRVLVTIEMAVLVEQLLYVAAIASLHAQCGDDEI
ncbi:hypothetical protein WT26_22025 [Burkholderia cepacia]|uniref:Uncharacterized protein n=2 Tax=Burkholderia cepacia complex TaxID=87882 RepID=A0A1B4PXL8_BURCE|nr:hypothetical protein WT26_22025 [Burkholderia cepacia]AOK25448.1 hypothetical protein WK67_21940 [Burkholderia ubonensis]